MKKCLMLLILIFMSFILVSCGEDRSYTIDKASIFAEITASGQMEVREIYTYTFDGEFNGMTRDIQSNERNFNAYLLPNDDHETIGDSANLESLETKLKNNEYKSFTQSEDETKTVLYTYEVNGSIEKYEDIGKLRYSFFSQDNPTDIHDLMITFILPESSYQYDLYAFLSEKSDGKLEKHNSSIVYTNDLLPKKEDSSITFLFPKSNLSEMTLTENKAMLEQLLSEAKDYQNRERNIIHHFNQLTPILYVLLIIIFIITGIMIYLHPNFRRIDLDKERALKIFENTDILFVSYLQRPFLKLKIEDILIALFSLKKRGFVTIKEIQSKHYHFFKNTTMSFTWVDDSKEINEADQYLRDWLFTKNDDGEECFILEEILDDVLASGKARRKKGQEVTKHLSAWKKMVLKQNDFQDVRESYPYYRWASMLFILMMGGIFYYFITVDLVTPQEQLGLKITLIVTTVLAIIFARNKFVSSSYYLLLVILSLINFSLFGAGLVAVFTYVMTLIASLCIPAYYWKAGIKQIKASIKVAKDLMYDQLYPVGTNPSKIENRLLYAVALGEGEKYAEQINQKDFGDKLIQSSTILANTDFVIQANSAIAIHAGSSGSSAGSSSGGGGAGAF